MKIEIQTHNPFTEGKIHSVTKFPKINTKITFNETILANKATEEGVKFFFQ